MACPTSTRCIAVGGSILTTDDAGQTWTQRTLAGGVGVLQSIACSSATTCVAIGPNPMVLENSQVPAIAIITTDAGNTWAPLDLPAGTANLAHVTCASGGSCFAVGPSPTPTTVEPLFTSSNGGTTWTQATPPGAMTDIADISCPSTSECVSVGYSGRQPAIGRTLGAVSSTTEQPSTGP